MYGKLWIVYVKEKVWYYWSIVDEGLGLGGKVLEVVRKGIIREWKEEMRNSRKGKGKNRMWKGRVDGVFEVDWRVNSESLERIRRIDLESFRIGVGVLVSKRGGRVVR